MPINEDTTPVCYSCGLHGVSHEGTFGHARLSSDGVWITLAGDERRDLCEFCCEQWFVRLDATLLAPVAGRPGSRTSPDARICDGCAHVLFQDCVPLNVLPLADDRASRSKSRTVRQVRSYSFCGRCAARARNTLWPGALRRQQAGRAVDGGESAGIRTHVVRFQAIGLSPSDESLVSVVSRRAGGDAEMVTVLGLDVAGRMLDHLRRQLSEARARCVVVAGPAQATQVRLALQLGVAGFLMTPISPQQLLSAGDRAVEPQPERHPVTALPLLDKAPPSSLAPGNLVTFKVPKDSEMDWALVLRRLLRGYDIIGMTSKGELCAAIYCDVDSIGRAVDRLKWAMGREVAVTMGGVPPTPALADTRPQVLSIDDAPYSLRLVEAALNIRGGIGVHAASTGLQGLTIARTLKPSLILLDLRLPDASGLDVLRQLRTMPETATIPVAMLSADGTSRQRELALASGAIAYFVKPLDLPSFVSFVQDIVASPEAARSVA